MLLYETCSPIKCTREGIIAALHASHASGDRQSYVVKSLSFSSEIEYIGRNDMSGAIDFIPIVLFRYVEYVVQYLDIIFQ